MSLLWHDAVGCKTEMCKENHPLLHSNQGAISKEARNGSQSSGCMTVRGCKGDFYAKVRFAAYAYA
jgi:hypothetical protein